MSLNAVLNTFGQIGVQVLKQAVAPLDASGKTQATIRYVVDGDQLLFLARSYFKLLEKGRRPTSKGPSREMIENLTEYAKARGFDEPKKAAWAIAIKMNKEGDITHRAGGRVLWSDVWETFKKDLREDLKKDFGLNLREQFKANFKHGT